MTPEPSSVMLSDLIDVRAVQSLMEDVYELTRIPMALLDLDGRVLVGVGWQDICTGFHRVHPETCRACTDSDIRLTAGIRPGEFRLYKCNNQMWDAATPVVVGDRHVGHVFCGQFFFDDEAIDHDVFRRQAGRYGFDDAEYLRALDRVPRLSRLQVDRGLSFFVKLAQMISRLGEANAGQARAIADRDLQIRQREQAEAALRVSLEELTRARESLEAANARLRDDDRRKDEFIAILSHELRNPLAPIRFALPVVEAQPLDEVGRRAAAVLDRQVQQLTRLVDDLLDVSRITGGNIELRREHTAIRTVLAAAAEAASPAIVEGRHAFRMEIEDADLWLWADPHRISQVVTNLLDNSAKYTPPGGEIVLAAHREKDDLVIRVRDNGLGIPSEALGTVFEMFRQVSRDDRPQGGGLGIGLAVVKRLVELHGGRIEARSAGVGLGAEFIVRLPLAEEPGPKGPARQATEAGEAPGRLRVLVVDDNSDLADMLGLLVESAGHDVWKAFDGRSAISAAMTFRPHVVLLDLGLPQMDGIAVAKELRRHRELAATRLVALTGWGQIEDRRRTAAAGFDFHLTKPADPDDVTRLLAGFAAAL